MEPFKAHCHQQFACCSKGKIYQHHNLLGMWQLHYLKHDYALNIQINVSATPVIKHGHNFSLIN